jgi:divalent metal cation (Fe/Co/Zn/Cd) transporter
MIVLAVVVLIVFVGLSVGIYALCRLVKKATK